MAKAKKPDTVLIDLIDLRDAHGGKPLSAKTADAGIRHIRALRKSLREMIEYYYGDLDLSSDLVAKAKKLAGVS